MGRVEIYGFTNKKENEMKRMILAFVLVTFTSCGVHAAEQKNKSSKVNKDKRANNKKDDNVTYLDMSKHDDDESSLPAITPKGKL
jgi:hypothetical protein